MNPEKLKIKLFLLKKKEVGDFLGWVLERKEGVSFFSGTIIMEVNNLSNETIELGTLRRSGWIVKDLPLYQAGRQLDGPHIELRYNIDPYRVADPTHIPQELEPGEIKSGRFDFILHRKNDSEGLFATPTRGVFFDLMHPLHFMISSDSSESNFLEIYDPQKRYHPLRLSD